MAPIDGPADGSATPEARAFGGPRGSGGDLRGLPLRGLSRLGRRHRLEAVGSGHGAELGRGGRTFQGGQRSFSELGGWCDSNGDPYRFHA